MTKSHHEKVTLNIFWLKDESLEDLENLPDPTFSPAKSPTTSNPRWINFGVFMGTWGQIFTLDKQVK